MKLARQKRIPVITINTHDPDAPADQKPDAYVGTSMYKLGMEWASYLVDNKLVKKGDKVWLPVEVPGATYETEESRGIKAVFGPLGIKTELFDAKYDPSECLTNMIDYLTAHRKEISAVVAMGDVVAEQIKPAFDKVGIKPGTLPVVGWGNALNTAKAVKEGYTQCSHVAVPGSAGVYVGVHGLSGLEGLAYQLRCVRSVPFYEKGCGQVHRYSDKGQQIALIC